MAEDTRNSTTTTTPTNFMILSDSGKPLFARYGTDEQVSQMCGVLQGLRASVLYDTTDLQLGDMHSLENDAGMRLVLWHVKGLTFVAVSHDSASGGTEAYLRFVLETLYCQLAFSLTQPVLDSISLYPNLDVESIMGRSTERQLHTILDQLDLLHDEEDNARDKQSTGTSLPSSSSFSSQLALVHAVGSGALQPLYPLSSVVRDEASRALRMVGDETPDTLFAFLFVQQPQLDNDASCRSSKNNNCGSASSSRLVSWVQSSVRALQLRAADATLLLLFLAQQSGSLVTNESLWLPVCLPRFNASGYVYCYAKCLDRPTGLCLGLVSHLGTTEQFDLFQQAAATLCGKLSIPVVPPTKPTAKRMNDIIPTTIKTSLPPSKTEDDVASDEDYVDASGDGDRMIPYVAAQGLVEEVAAALDETLVAKLHAHYLDLGKAVHFVFRYDVVLPRSSRQQAPGRLPQCLCVGHDEHFVTAASRRALWSTYDKLMMRLRLGSAQSESIQDALGMIAQNRQEKYGEEGPPVHVAVDHACHASALLEAPPDFAGMTSECQGEYRHVGINGESFELYFTVLSELSVKQATALGAKLVRRLMMDQHKLFLWNPMVWKK